MWFQRLEIHDLRNLERVDITLCPALNYFHGDNGAGKTAILEAVHLLARGRSFRSSQPSDLIRRGADSLLVRAEVGDEHRGQVGLGLVRHRNGRAELRMNGRPERKLSQAAQLLPLQVMGPGLSDLVFGSPAERRQWLDWGLFHVEHGYLAVLRQYLHAVRQRNAGLRAVARGDMELPGLTVWTDAVIDLASQVSESRGAYLERLLPELERTLQELAPELDLEVAYRRGWPADQSLRKVLGESTRREVKSGVTQSGPHRADVDLRVAGLAAATSLSRGQGKALASAMMLAQARLLRSRASRSSVFLIDDIGAELDLPHSGRFFRILTDLGAQVLATSNSDPRALTSLPAVEIKAFHVEHGRVTDDQRFPPRQAYAAPNEDSA